LTIGTLFGVSVGAGAGVGAGVCTGVGVGEAFGVGVGTFTPLPQTNFFPDLMQVYLKPPEMLMELSFVHADPALIAALANMFI